VIEGHVVKEQTGESEELRNHPRYRVDLRLKVITGITNNGRSIFGRGSDISEGGMRVFVPADLEIGESVTLELTLPYSDHKVIIRGVLRNRLGFSYGVEYAANTTLQERQSIARACKALSLLQ
jgi:PilZ domain